MKNYPKDCKSQSIRRILRSEKTIQSLLKDASEIIFFSKKAAEFTDSVNIFSRKKALHQAVETKLCYIDQDFFVVLNAYVRLSMAIRAEDVTEVMLEIKEVVLTMARREMHPQLKYLEKITRLQTRKERFEKIDIYLKRMKSIDQSTKTYSSFDSTAQNPPLVQLYLAANQLVEDMESLNHIPNLRLLARTVLVREELRLLGQEFQTSSKPTLFSIHYSSKVPTTEMAFLKELIKIEDRDNRNAILTRSFRNNDNLENMFQIYLNDSKNKKLTPNVLKKDSFDMKSNIAINSSNINSFIRPGRLLDSIHAARAESLRKRHGKNSGIKQLMDIWLESSKILEEIANSNE